MFHDLLHQGSIVIYHIVNDIIATDGLERLSGAVDFSFFEPVKYFL